jgi:hypothetical protein
MKVGSRRLYEQLSRQLLCWRWLILLLSHIRIKALLQLRLLLWGGLPTASNFLLISSGTPTAPAHGLFRTATARYAQALLWHSPNLRVMRQFQVLDTI